MSELDVSSETPARRRASSPFLPNRKAKTPAGSAITAALAAMEPTSAHPLVDATAFALIVPGARHGLTPFQVSKAQELLADVLKHEINAYAPNSARSIRADWRHWLAFCIQHDRVCLPVAFDDLAYFLKALVAAGYKRATLDHMLFTLRLMSQLFSSPSPTDSIQFKWFWRSLCRSDALKRAQHQAKGLNIEMVDDVVHAAAANALEGDTADLQLVSKRAMAVRDAAFVALAYQLMARSSEMVVLRWEDVAFDEGEDDGATCVIRRSKTDQEGKSIKKYIQSDAATLLKSWQKLRLAARELLWPEGQLQLDSNPYIFHRVPRYRVLAPRPGRQTAADRWDVALTVREGDRILKRTVGIAYSSHSARVGAAQDLTSAGEELPYIMQEGRWTSTAMPARYAANELAVRAGKKRKHSLDKLRAARRND
ncbi:tyrosine-type recombinase/integrase [Stenotrophomonas maltophilia]|uniref:tyrosine-type recombinase/integrase n=1 Tax=Stenotrophomonas maltophilia TaxID=40324 RepID=UPI00244A0575|nr:tyrosine-type recombinase/integrase [Stenotrophomonas maltophilia]MDH0740928.1 tyrosine-type recombinase/integrase [Stenotrophomonas maltophilia]MDH1328364.1 tyrosine-type recombinase/integrase [Stenotrophomonas maltophilia]